MLNLMEARMLLGITPSATASQVQAAFRSRVRSLHPDHGGPGGDMSAFVVAKAMVLEHLRVSDAPVAAEASGGQVVARPRSDHGFEPLFATAPAGRGAFVAWDLSDRRPGRLVDVAA